MHSPALHLQEDKVIHPDSAKPNPPLYILQYFGCDEIKYRTRARGIATI